MGPIRPSRTEEAPRRTATVDHSHEEFKTGSLAMESSKSQLQARLASNRYPFFKVSIHLDQRDQFSSGQGWYRVGKILAKD